MSLTPTGTRSSSIEKHRLTTETFLSSFFFSFHSSRTLCVALSLLSIPFFPPSTNFFPFPLVLIFVKGRDDALSIRFFSRGFRRLG